jgi:prepilin-type N-terminal cleavage/methylation domain-containing protein
MFKNFKKIKKNKGVTLVELLVVIFIFVVISGITIFDYGKFRSSLSVQNLADDIALSVRKAQGYAIGVHSEGSAFNIGYGVHFTLNPNNVDNQYSGNNSSFILFSDMGTSEDKMYSHGSQCGNPEEGDECLEMLNIASTDIITGIQYFPGGTLVTKDINPKGTLDIVFKRPDPEPIFCYKDRLDKTSCEAGGSNNISNPITSVEITLSTVSAPTVSKKIKISNNGQISVN